MNEQTTQEMNTAKNTAVKSATKRADWEKLIVKARRMGEFTAKQIATPPGVAVSRLQARNFISYAERAGLIEKTENRVMTGKRGQPAVVYKMTSKTVDAADASA